METLNHLIANNPQADISALILQAAGGNSQSQPSQQQSFANQPSHSSQHQQLMQHHSLPMSMGHSDIRNLDHLHGDDTSKSRSAPLPGKKVTRPPLPPQVQNLGHNPPPPPAALRMNGSSVAGHGVRSDPTGASKVSGRPWSLGQGHNFQTGVTGTQTGGGNHQQGYDSPTQTSQDPSHMVELQLTPQQAEMLFMGQGGLRLQPGDVSVSSSYLFIRMNSFLISKFSESHCSAQGKEQGDCKKLTPPKKGLCHLIGRPDSTHGVVARHCHAAGLFDQ